MRLFSHCIILFLVLALSARSGQAQSTPAGQTVRSDAVIAQANELFASAKREQAEGHLAQACASFQESYRLAPRSGTLINLALCHRELGELVTARKELIKALEAAQRDGRADREAIAIEQLNALERELSWLDVATPADIGTNAASVSIDGHVLTPEQAAEGSIALMPGDHNLRIEAHGFDPVELQLHLHAGSRTRVPAQPLRPTVIIPQAKRADMSAPAPATAPTPAAEQTDPYAAWRTTGLVLTLAGVGLGLAAGAWALERKSVVRKHCDPTSRKCDQAGLDAAAVGSTLATASTISCGIGLAGLSGWLLLPGGTLNERASAAAGGVFWRGQF
jgi:hypothetical protein